VLAQLPPWAADCYLRLLHGALAEGFRRFEGRHRIPLPGVPWTGQSISGRTILLKGAEGGFGDDLMFARYIPLIAERGGRVILMIQRKLARLLAAMPGVIRTVPTDPYTGSPEQLSAPGVAVSYDYWASFMSLPHAFGTTMETIPSRPYLHGDPTAWRPFLDSLPGLRVGICWAGA
jgi:hypothetical protein